jgi:hypothetical protein
MPHELAWLAIGVMIGILSTLASIALLLGDDDA